MAKISQQKKRIYPYVLLFRYLDLAKEISAIRGCALLNLFEIDAKDMNLNMSTHASGLRDDLIKWQVIFFMFWL